MKNGIMGSDAGGAPAGTQGRDVNAGGVGLVCSGHIPTCGG